MRDPRGLVPAGPELRRLVAAGRVLRPRGGLLMHEHGDVELVGPRRRNPARALGRRRPGSAA